MQLHLDCQSHAIQLVPFSRSLQLALHLFM